MGRGRQVSREMSTKTTQAQLSVKLPADLLEEIRDIVVALSGPPDRLTLAAFAEQALRNEASRFRKRYKQGNKFAARTAPLRAGRPIGPRKIMGRYRG